MNKQQRINELSTELTQLRLDTADRTEEGARRILEVSGELEKLRQDVRHERHIRAARIMREKSA